MLIAFHFLSPFTPRASAARSRPGFIVTTVFFGVLTVMLAVVLAVAALAGVISLILYTVAVLEYPFDGSLRVEPDAFELVLHITGESSS